MVFQFTSMASAKALAVGAAINSLLSSATGGRPFLAAAILSLVLSWLYVRHLAKTTQKMGVHILIIAGLILSTFLLLGIGQPAP